MSAGVDAKFRLTLGDFTLDAELSLPATGVSGIFGPSGSGKTTLLRCLAGLEPEVEGRLSVNGQTWQSPDIFLAPEDRALGVVFQDTRVFAHLTVEQNLRYGYKRTPEGRRRITFDEVIATLGIEPLLERNAHMLSGGESQRVAIGRALLTSPALLLLDEPMAALDLARKAEIFPFLDRMHRELDIPMVYVSHDLGEITRLADTLATMDGGKILACGPLAQTLTTVDVMDHSGALAVTVRAGVTGYDAAFGALDLELPGGHKATVPGPRLDVGERVSLRIAASHVSLYAGAPGDAVPGTEVAATVERAPTGDGPLLAVPVDIGGATLLSLVSQRRAAGLDLTPGSKVTAVISHAEVIATSNGARQSDD